jgi:replicative DNA helicase
MGKSCLAGSVAMSAARRGKRVAMFSLEMTGAELAGRWIAGLTGITTDCQRHGKIEPGDWQRLVHAQEELRRLAIFVDDQPRLSVAQMRQRCRRMRRRAGLDLVIIDHLQLVRQGGKQESRRLEIGDASSMIKAIAKELGVPILVLSQLSRSPEQRDDKRPILSDLRESGDIEQDADVVMFLYRDEYYLQRAEPRRRASDTADGFASKQADWTDAMSAAKGIAEIIVAKNRHGRTGVAKAYFDGERQTFTDLARGYP